MQGADDLGGDDAGAGRVAGEADVERDIEPDRNDGSVVSRGELEPGLAVFAAKIGGVDDGGPRGDRETLAKEVAHGAEDAGVDGLVCFVAGEEEAGFVGAEDGVALGAGPGGFTGTGKTDEHVDPRLCHSLKLEQE